MKMNNVVKGVRVLKDYTLRVTFVDGYVGTVDCSLLFQLHDWPIVQELRDKTLFQQVSVQHGVVTFPTGYDICADVLRYYCELGHVCSQEELDSALGANWKVTEAVPA
jgi:hypothetical protein